MCENFGPQPGMMILRVIWTGSVGDNDSTEWSHQPNNDNIVFFYKFRNSVRKHASLVPTSETHGSLVRVIRVYDTYKNNTIQMRIHFDLSHWKIISDQYCDDTKSYKTKCILHTVLTVSLCLLRICFGWIYFPPKIRIHFPPPPKSKSYLFSDFHQNHHYMFWFKYFILVLKTSGSKNIFWQTSDG